MDYDDIGIVHTAAPRGAIALRAALPLSRNESETGEGDVGTRWCTGVVDVYKSGREIGVMLHGRPRRARCPPGRRSVRVDQDRFRLRTRSHWGQALATTAPVTDAPSDIRCPARLSQIGRRMTAELQTGTMQTQMPRIASQAR